MTGGGRPRPATYLAAAALLVGYSAFAGWVVRGEGASYRRARLAASTPPPTVASSVPDPAPAPAPPPAVVARVEAKPVATPRPEVPKPAPAPPPAPVAVAVAPPAAPKVEPYWATPRMTRVWDTSRFGPEEERQLGEALNELILERNREVVDGPFVRRAEAAAAPLLATVARKGVRYTFTVLDSPAVFAFSHPGGYVYLSRGLFDLIGDDEDEDYVLQFVVGHEIAHVDLQHVLACLSSGDVKTSGLGTLPTFYLFVLPLGYFPEQDFQADGWAFERMKRLGRSEHQAKAFLARFRGYAKAHGFENGRGKQKPPADLSSPEIHFRSHPAAYKRLDALTPGAASPSR